MPVSPIPFAKHTGSAGRGTEGQREPFFANSGWGHLFSGLLVSGGLDSVAGFGASIEGVEMRSADRVGLHVETAV